MEVIKKRGRSFHVYFGSLESWEQRELSKTVESAEAPHVCVCVYIKGGAHVRGRHKTYCLGGEKGQVWEEVLYD